MLGIISLATVTLFKAEYLTCISPICSLLASLTFSIVIFAFISFKTCKNPILVGLMPTFSIHISASFEINAAPIRKAADEKSPGTKTSFAFVGFVASRMISVSPLDFFTARSASRYCSKSSV